VLLATFAAASSSGDSASVGSKADSAGWNTCEVTVTRMASK
jgi:hypothetical protein